jgi:hypothetical protein
MLLVLCSHCLKQCVAATGAGKPFCWCQQPCALYRDAADAACGFTHGAEGVVAGMCSSLCCEVCFASGGVEGVYCFTGSGALAALVTS